MDSRAVQTQAHDEHHYDRHNVGSKQVTHGDQEDHHHDHEKKSVLKKVKAKAKKIKDTITKHGHHDDHEHGHEYHYEDQHIPDDHDLDEEDDEDEEMVEDPEIHGAPIYDSAAVRSGTPGQVQNIGKPGTNFGGTTTMIEPPHHDPRVVVVSPTSELSRSKVTDPARTFVGEDHGMQRKVNLERPMGLEEDPHGPLSRPEAHAPANYQTKVTDPTGAGGAEIDITPVQKSFTNMAVHNVPKPNLEPKILPTIAETQYPSAGSHHQFDFVPELSTATKTPFPSAQTHVHNMPQLSPEIKTQYPRDPSAQTHYPSPQTHDHSMPQFSSGIETQYPRNPSAQTHDHNLPQLSGGIETQYPRSPSAQTHDHNPPQLSREIGTQYPLNPSGQTHDHNLPQMSSGIKAPYPRSHDQLMPALPTSTKTQQYPSTKSDEQNLAGLSAATETRYPSAGSHDKFVSDMLYTEPKPQHSSAKTHHDQHLPQMSSATNTQYPSVGSHDQFLPEPTQTKTHYHQDLPQMSSATKIQYPSVGSHDQFLPESTQTKTHYPYAKNHAQFVPEAIPTSTHTYSENPQPTTTTTVEGQHQPSYESIEKPSNESSYTEKISSATSAIADKAITAKNAVASKLGYGEKDHGKDQNQARYHEENTRGEKPSNQSSYTEKIASATSAIADKAVSAKNTVASKLGYEEKGDDRENKVTLTPHEEKQSENNSNTNSAAEYGKTIALSLTEKLAPVYGKVAGVGSAVKAKVPGTGREKSGAMEQDKGVSMKDYLAEKLRPGVEEKALSEMISESLYKKEEEAMDQVGEEEGRRDVKKVVSDVAHKREEEPGREQGHGRLLGKVTESEEVKRRLGTGSGDEKTEKWFEESYANSPGKGVVDKVKDVVGSWFGSNTGENQSSQVAGVEELSKNKNTGAGVKQVSQAAGERRLQEN